MSDLPSCGGTGFIAVPPSSPGPPEGEVCPGCPQCGPAAAPPTQGLVDLLTRIGDARLQFQYLDQCMRGAQSLRRGVTEIRFGTQAITPTDIATDSGPMGFVVWVERADVQAAWEAFKGDEVRQRRLPGGRDGD